MDQTFSLDLDGFSRFASFNQAAALYVVATPLGNLADMSLRGLAVLKQVDLIAAEDTRHSQRLLDAYGIRTRMLPLHEHNEQQGANQIVQRLSEGLSVALISDAGTPAISDPGARLVRRVCEAGFDAVPVPGACAAIAALSASGLLDSQFHFVGFLPPKAGARRFALERYVAMSAALVLYEAPHRIVECVADLAIIFGAEREVVFCRELTKRFEQIERMPLGDALPWLQADPNRQRGEFVVLLAGAPAQNDLDAPVHVSGERILRCLLEELPLKQAAALAASISGIPRKRLYEYALTLKNENT